MGCAQQRSSGPNSPQLAAASSPRAAVPTEPPQLTPGGFQRESREPANRYTPFTRSLPLKNHAFPIENVGKPGVRPWY